MLSALVAVPLLAGCAQESARQADARTAVEASLDPVRYDSGRTRCTDNPAPWFIERQADIFLCIAPLRAGGCHRYRATLKNAGWEVVRERSDPDCMLPF